MSLVEVSGLEKSFGDQHVLRGVDFAADRGTVTVVLGPSGSGKTTLLRSLNALEIPDRGIVRVGDVSVDFGNPPTSRRLRSGSTPRSAPAAAWSSRPTTCSPT